MPPPAARLDAVRNACSLPPMQPLCLTFDNGPEPEVTPGVLATLARRGIPATFFLIGEKRATRPAWRLPPA